MGGPLWTVEFSVKDAFDKERRKFMWRSAAEMVKGIKRIKEVQAGATLDVGEIIGGWDLSVMNPGNLELHLPGSMEEDFNP